MEIIEKNKVVVLMGVMGSGKTVVGELLAQKIGWEFLDGDDFHPDANKEKMATGVPLTDEDRFPWLQVLSAEIGKRINKSENVVLACSALKASYRDILLSGQPEVCFIHLKGPKELISPRLEKRVHNYMPTSLLNSQFETLEEPEDALIIDISPTPTTIVDEIRRKLEI